jgi:hypothetical protein
MTGEEIVAVARKWLQVPFRPCGRSRSGIDCLGLLVVVARDLNVPHRDEPHYAMWGRSDHLLLKRMGESLHRERGDTPLRAGLIGAFAVERLPVHAGIFSMLYGRPHLIHARVVPPRVIEESFEMIPRHECRLIALFSLPGMED